MINDVILGRFSPLRAHKHAITKHELLPQTWRQRIVRELIPHRSNDRPAVVVGLLERGIEVVSLCITLFDCVKNNLLDPLRPGPWLTILERRDTGVCSHERIENSGLILLHEVILGRVSIETWQICPCKAHTRDAERKCHLNEHWHIGVANLAVTCPHRTISL